MKRRKFLATGAKAGAMLAGHSLVPGLLAFDSSPSVQPPDISIVESGNCFHNTIRAVELLGGIDKFVKPGDRVGLLANSGYRNPGTYTRPEVMLAIAWLCKEAGAASVISFKGEDEDYWRRSQYASQHRSLISDIKADESDHKEVLIENGVILEEASVLAGFLDYDKVINLPIMKNHGEIHMTCTLKNTMGISSFGTNIKFHTGGNIVTGAVRMLVDPYHNMEHLAQCIADLNLVRRWDLCVVDATEFITTNGPSGPGNLVREQKIIAGADPLALEALCGRYIGLQPQESMMVQKAHLNQLGEMDLEKMTIVEKYESTG